MQLTNEELVEVLALFITLSTVPPIEAFNLLQLFLRRKQFKGYEILKTTPINRRLEIVKQFTKDLSVYVENLGKKEL